MNTFGGGGTNDIHKDIHIPSQVALMISKNTLELEPDTAGNKNLKILRNALSGKYYCHSLRFRQSETLTKKPKHDIAKTIFNDSLSYKYILYTDSNRGVIRQLC